MSTSQFRIPPSDWIWRDEAHFHVLCGASQLEHAYEHAALHAVVKRLPPKAGEPRSGSGVDYFAYNFITLHRTVRVTPAMAANVTDRLFDVMDLGEPAHRV